MVTVSFQVGVSISALVCQALFERSYYQWACQEPYNGNHQQLHFIPHIIQKVAQNVLHIGHQLLEIG